MTNLEKLDSEIHRDMRVSDKASAICAEGQHVMHVRATEIARAACCFPIFCGRHAVTGDWVISAIAGLEQGQNLFIQDGSWTATYLPTSIQTYPLYLMNAPDEERGFAVGINAESNALSNKQGEKLFEKNGDSSLFLKGIIRILEADVDNDIQTHHFLAELDREGLFKSIDVIVHYENSETQTITELHTIDEEKLQTLSEATLQSFHKRGFLLLIHAMLVSIHQLNALIQRHNRVPNNRQISQIKLGIARDASASDAGI